MKGALTEANSYRIKEVVADLQIALEHPIFIEKRSGSENAEIVFRELKRLLEMIKDETTQLNEHLEMISSLKNQWYDSVRRASARNVEQAEKEYMEFVGSNYDAGSIADAKARLLFLAQRKRFLEAELDVCEVRLLEVKAVNREPQHIATSNISLPKIQLEKFNGNRAEWFEFYENFNASVNVPTLTNTQRFTYLRTLLAGEAKTMIQGLALTDENYEVAIDLLKERYGNRAELLRQLYHDLSILPVCRTFGDCRDFLYKLEGLCRQLEALGETYDSPLLYHELELKLTKPILKEILIRKERYVQWNTAVFRMVLREVIQKEELLFRMMDTQNSRESKLRPPVNSNGRSEKSKDLGPTLTFATTTSSSAPKFSQRPPNCFQNKAGMNFVKKGPHCAFCAASHWTAECDKFTTLESREKQKNFLKLCNKCLSKQHVAVDCKTVLKPCFYCKQTGHHQALCSQKFAVSQANVSAVASLKNKTNTALLMTVKAKMINPESNIQKEVIIFFDSGSHRSFVTNEVAETLKLNTMNSGSIKLYTFGSNVAKEHQSRLAQVKIESVNGSMIPLTVDIVDTIIPREIPMALMNDMNVTSSLDSHFTVTCENNKPDVLIGMDQMPKFEVSQIKLLNNGYALFDSRLGLIISGKDDSVNDNCDSQMSVFVANVIEKQINEDSLFQLVNNHYELEKAGLEEETKSEEEKEILEKFNKSLRLVEGRYEVSLPWKFPMPSLDSNYGLARGRLRGTMRKLQEKPQLMNQYHQIMMDQLKKGVIEKVPRDQVMEGSIIHYLPHQPVIKEDKLFTKLRVVYDGSAKTNKNGNSINQCLHRGPVLLRDLVGLLLRFRLPKIIIVADIEKAFLQLSIAPEDRDVCRFLWPSDPRIENWEQEIEVYRFCRVTFGLVCSPFLLAATIEEHLRRENTPLSMCMKNNVYVDNIVVTAESSEKTLSVCQEAKKLFEKVSMNLREFASNDYKSISALREEDRVPTRELKFLGIRWDTIEDCFTIQLKFQEESKPTKRLVLKTIAAVYDPMGWISPAMLEAKLFFQKLWTCKLKWDDMLPEEMIKEWKLIGRKCNGEMKLKRKVFTGVNKTFEIHIFADASKLAHGAVAYIVAEESVESHKATMIFAKCRVNAINTKATIPRLELQALNLAAKMAKFLLREFEISKEKVFLWTDSQICVHWLKSTSRLERFVENRVPAIREFKVNYVETHDNPADLITRGLKFEDLMNSEEWWQGLEWIKKPLSTLIVELSFHPEEYEKLLEKEQRPNFHEITAHVQIPPCIESIIDLSRYSTLARATKVTAYVLRFLRKINKSKNTIINKFECPMESDGVTALERVIAQHFLIWEAQHRCEPSDEIKKSLALFLEDDLIWKCRGRIEESDIEDGAKSPIWLPKNDRLTQLIVIYHHELSFHAATGTTLAAVRHRFWFSKGRRVIKDIIRRSCLICRRFYAEPFKLPLMPNLPKERVIRSRPFESVGVDYFGPIHVKTSKENDTSKIWGCIFTCFVTRAVHLEVASDLSAEAFLSVFRRFVSRRATPKLILSDNGTNFKLASKVIERAWKEVLISRVVTEEMSKKGVTWKFIADRAPWRGGFWERLISIIKNALRKTVGRKTLKLEEFSTLLTEIEGVVNNRPLTFISEDDSLKSLRPIDFLIPYEIAGLSPVNDNNGDDNFMEKGNSRDKLLNQFQNTAKNIDKFWEIWKNDYLLALLEKHNSLSFPRNTGSVWPVGGEIVLVGEYDVPRSQWKIARVLELLPGRDGGVRTAKILSGKRVVIRAVNVLYPLEIEKDPEIITSMDMKKQAVINEPLVASFSKPLVASQSMNNKPLVASSSKSFVSRQTRPSLDDRLQMFKRQRKLSSSEAGVSRKRGK